MKICFFGSYDQNYARNIVIINAMRSAGLKVTECNDSSGMNFLFRAFSLFFRLLKLDFDILWVGYPGHLDVLPAKIVCMLKRKPLVFDVFISKYDSEVEYGIIKNKKSLRAKFLRFIDKMSCTLPDLVFLDTPQHIDFFVNEFNLPKSKFRWLFIGADEQVFARKKTTLENKKFRVLYYGRTTPLHGFFFIINAAKSLEAKAKDVEFIFIGENIHFRKLRDSGQKPSNCIFMNSVSSKKIADYISKADVCLGIFGTTPKASRVIPNKVFEPLAMGKAVITAKTAALGAPFAHKKNIFFVKAGSGDAIANAILELKKNKKLKNQIAENGHKLFMDKFNYNQLGLTIRKTLSDFFNM